MEGSSFCRALVAFFILLQFTTYMNSCSAATGVHTKTNTEYIKTSCHVTQYPRLCYSSLSRYASEIQTSPKLLTNKALTLTLAAANSTSTMVQKLSKTHGLKPTEAAAIQDCVKELETSVHTVQKSMKALHLLNSSNFHSQISDIQTWVSGAMTDENTCMDGFADFRINGNVKTTIQRHIERVDRLMSNALGLINKYASAHLTPSN